MPWGLGDGPQDVPGIGWRWCGGQRAGGTIRPGSSGQLQSGGGAEAEHPVYPRRRAQISFRLSLRRIQRRSVSGELYAQRLCALAARGKIRQPLHRRDSLLAGSWCSDFRPLQPAKLVAANDQERAWAFESLAYAAAESGFPDVWQAPTPDRV